MKPTKTNPRAESLLRGHKVPLVVVRIGERVAADEDCPTGGEDRGSRTQAWLFWSAAGRRLAEFQGESGLLCCQAWTHREAPARLQVLTAECAALSCGGACGQTTRVIAVPEDLPHEAAALERQVGAHPARAVGLPLTPLGPLVPCRELG